MKEKLPNICVLYAENWRKNYRPEKAEAALKGKAETAFVPLKNFDANTISLTVFDLQEKPSVPDYIVIDIPNDTSKKNVDDIAFAVRALGDKKSRRVVLATVKNEVATDEDFYNRGHIPVVGWNNIAASHRFNSDEILLQQKKKPQKTNVFNSLWSMIPGVKHLRLSR